MNKQKTYTFYARSVELTLITNEAIALRKWYGLISKDGIQAVMVYDEETLYKMLLIVQKHNMTIYYRVPVGLYDATYKPYTEEMIEEQLLKLSKGFKKEFKWPTDVNEILKYNKGSYPRFSPKSSTGRGSANCSKCYVCVCNLIYEDNKVVGWLETTCKCGEDINWSEADKYL